MSASCRGISVSRDIIARLSIASDRLPILILGLCTPDCARYGPIRRYLRRAHAPVFKSKYTHVLSRCIYVFERRYIYINIDRNEFDSPFVSFPKDINRIIEIKLIGNDRYWTSSSMRFRIINCTYGSSMNNRAQRQLHRMKDLKYLE